MRYPGTPSSEKSALLRAAKLAFELALVCAGALVLAHCGPGGPAGMMESNSPLSNDEAEIVLGDRLERTTLVRAQLEAIREVIEPIDSVVRDLGHEVGTEAREEIGDTLSATVGTIKRALSEASKGLVLYNDQDRSWSSKRVLTESILKPRAACRNAQIAAFGRKEGENEVIELVLEDCTAAGPLNFATALAQDANIIEVIFHPLVSTAAGQQLNRVSEMLKKCVVRIQEDRTAMDCEPFSFLTQEGEFLVEKMSVKIEGGEVAVDAFLSLKDIAGDSIGEFDYRLAPGQEKAFRACLKATGCDLRKAAEEALSPENQVKAEKLAEEVKTEAKEAIAEAAPEEKREATEAKLIEAERKVEPVIRRELREAVQKAAQKSGEKLVEEAPSPSPVPASSEIPSSETSAIPSPIPNDRPIIDETQPEAALEPVTQ